MEIADLSWKEVTSKRFNHPLLPRTIRGLIVGKSNCEKTTLLLKGQINKFQQMLFFKSTIIN